MDVGEAPPQEPGVESGSQALYADLKNGEFRVMRIVRSDGHQLEHAFELRAVHTGEEGLVYKALSYCWGDHEASSQILLQGRNFPVRPNLFEFLSQMAESKSDDWWFIDAVCINQLDIAERTVQVGLMGDIYQNAEEVCVWLSDLRYQQDPDIVGSTSSIDEKYSAVSELPRHTSDVCTQSVNERKQAFPAAAYISVQCNSYWLRLWIIQEVMLAKRLVIRWHAGMLDQTMIDALSTHYDKSVMAESDLGSAWVNHQVPIASIRSITADEELQALAMCMSILETRKSWGPHIRAGRTLLLYQVMAKFGAQRCLLLHDHL